MSMTEHRDWLKIKPPSNMTAEQIIVRQFIQHTKILHRQEFPHEHTIDPSNPSEQAERYFWLIGFLHHCAETFTPTAPTEMQEAPKNI